MTSGVDGSEGIVGLVPARNCAADLPGLFAALEPLVDAVVALDDGSTDETGLALEAHPLVKVLLKNPRRDTYVGWDDAMNRQRLLDAAADLSPAWVVWIDADERMPADDAHALRDFLTTSADRRAAYLLRVLRMVDDLDHYDRDPVWVGRVFAFERGQRLPRRKLHAVPLPTSIPRERWLRTTFRIQHLGSLDAAARAARFAKYAEADPDRRFQTGYDHLLNEPSDVHRWEPRPPCLPPLEHGVWPHEQTEAHAEHDAAADVPAMSAIVITQNDEDCIERVVRAVVEQECPDPFEVIVVSSGTDRTADVVRTAFPEVQVVELSHAALPGEARNAGVAVARGRYLTFPGSHVELLPGSLAARLRAHRLGYAMVTGTVHNGTPTRAGWANFFLDHNSGLAGRPTGPLAQPPASCSYLRVALDYVGGFPEYLRAGEDSWVNAELFRLGYGAWRQHDARYVHVTRCRTGGRLVRHHFTRGRSYGKLIRMRQPPGQPLFTRRLLRSTLVLYVPGRVWRVRRNVLRWAVDDMRREWARSLPLVVAATTASWLGAWFELLRGSD